MIRFTTAPATLPGQYRTEADGTHRADCRCEWGCDTATPARSPLPVRAARAALDFVGGWVAVALVVGIMLGHAAATVHAAPAAPAPAALTLTDAHGWTADAVLDTTQVEAAEVDTWPLGTGIDAATEVAWTVVDAGAETGWSTYLTDAGYVPVPDGTIVAPDGTPHPGCWILVGDTSHVVCADGWEDES